LTIAIGVSCQEGAVLLTDGLWRLNAPDGIGLVAGLHDGLALGTINGLAYVLSGQRNPTWGMKDYDRSDINAMARAMHADLPREAELHPAIAAMVTEADQWRLRAQELIVVPVDYGRHPMMGMIANDGEWWAGPEGATYIAGAARQWVTQYAPWVLPRLESERRPTTVDGCYTLAIRIARWFMDFINSEHQTLSDHLAGGQLPAAAYPLWLRIIDSTITEPQVRTFNP
jgi:hypothetical protein